MEIVVVDEGRGVKVAAEFIARGFAIRDESGKAVEGLVGSVGFGVYAPVVIDNLRHQLTVSIIVNKSKGWTDADKAAWIAAHEGKSYTVTVSGYADTFRKAGNSGWRFNTQAVVEGRPCTVTGSLVLSAKTVKKAGERAEKAAARDAKTAAAVTKHEAKVAEAQKRYEDALAKQRAQREKDVAALKGAKA